MVIVSHAREFLNAVCTDIVHLHARTLTQYKGDYDIFARTFKDRVKTSQAAAAAQEEKRAHMLEFINKFRYNANRAALVQSRIKALERMTGGMVGGWGSGAGEGAALWAGGVACMLSHGDSQA